MGSQGKHDILSGQAATHEFDALLFDMDGTLIDSTPAIVEYWKRLGKCLGVDGEQILNSSHGVRSIETVAQFAPKLANWSDIVELEGRIPRDFGESAVELPGSRAILDALSTAGARWTIVTSGTRPLVTGWLKTMQLAQPSTMVTAEDVPKGKPDPACYRLGAARLGLSTETQDPSRLLVLEDSPAGTRAGKAAGFKVLAVATTHTTAQLREAGADWIVQDLRSIRLDENSKTTSTGCATISMYDFL